MPSKSTPDYSYNETLTMQERGLHYGDGLFETLLKKNGNIVFWDDHYERLYKGCRRLHITPPAKEWLAQKLDSPGDAVIKIIVTRGQGGRGLTRPSSDKTSVFFLDYSYTPVKEIPALSVSVCKTRLSINPNLAGIKHLNRLDYVLAAIELESRGCKDEGILLDSDGFLVEGIISNLFFCHEGEVYTPALEYSGVDGVMRKQVLQYLNSRSIAVKIGRFVPKLLKNASECFLCNSVQGIRPVVSVDQHDYPIGPLSLELIDVFNFNPGPPTVKSS